jgi:hypothetical protein
MSTIEGKSTLSVDITMSKYVALKEILRLKSKTIRAWVEECADKLIAENNSQAADNE